MKADLLLNKTFVSGPHAMTDIHNAGSIFGVIFNRILVFEENNNITLKNEIKVNRGMADWEKFLKSDNWAGKYELALGNKHFKCTLIKNDSNKKMTMYIDIVEEGLIFGEFYYDNEGHGHSFAFKQID